MVEKSNKVNGQGGGGGRKRETGNESAVNMIKGKQMYKGNNEREIERKMNTMERPKNRYGK